MNVVYGGVHEDANVSFAHASSVTRKITNLY